MAAGAYATAPGRVRDPDRKRNILAAAARLFAENGYHAVSMEDIGDAVGITASAIYRHYDSKLAVLQAMFDDVVDTLLDRGGRLADLADADPATALRDLVDSQIDLVTRHRAVAQVYYRERATLPEPAQRSLRRRQRLYVEEWAHLLTELRPELDDVTARVVVHAAIGAVQSSLQHAAGVPDGDLRALLHDAATAVLTGVPRPVRKRRG